MFATSPNIFACKNETEAHSRNLRHGSLANMWRNESRINRFLPFVFGEHGTQWMKTLSFAKTSSFFKCNKVLYLLKGISCNHDYSAFKKYTVYRGFCWNRERENDPRADSPSGLADTLSGFHYGTNTSPFIFSLSVVLYNFSTCFPHCRQFCCKWIEL